MRIDACDIEKSSIELQIAGERDRAAAVRGGRREREVAALAQILPELERNVPLALDAARPGLAGSRDVGRDLILQRGE